MYSTREGMQIDVRNLQYSNAPASIRCKCEPPSNITDESVAQPAKHLSQSDVTDEGIRMERSDRQSAKTRSSIRESDEAPSNSTRHKSPQPAKAP
jgi:hypothetical protein